MLKFGEKFATIQKI